MVRDGCLGCDRALENSKQIVVLQDIRGERVFITNVKGTFLGMSESEEASKRR